LPGETRMQVSLMYNFKAASSSTGTLRGQWYIQSASISGSSGTITGYDSWSTPENLFSTSNIISNINSTGTYEGGSISFSTTTTPDRITTHQGRYVRIYLIVDRSSTGDANDMLAFKGFVYRTSRVTGASTTPPPQGVIS
jgi:hypothetical protein